MAGRLAFVHGPLPHGFKRHVITIAPGCSRPVVASEWRGAIIVIDHGDLAAQGVSGRCYHFEAGDILCLAGTSLRALHNRGDDAAVLIAVARAPAIFPSPG